MPIFLAQLVMLWAVIRERHLTGAGALVFMSFLFFALRPVYVWAEQDYRVFEGLFRMNPTKVALNEGMLWATLGMLTFQVGSILAKRLHWNKWRARHIKAQTAAKNFSIAGVHMLALILLYQVATLGIMVLLASAGRSLYGSALGAYIYDLPAVMQAGHIFVDLSPPDAVDEDIGGRIVRQHDHQHGQIVQRERRLAVAEALQDSAAPDELRLANLHPLTELENCRLILA